MYIYFTWSYSNLVQKQWLETEIDWGKFYFSYGNFGLLLLLLFFFFFVREI